MSNKMMECQDFLLRCLISFPESTSGKRQYVEEDLDKDIAISNYYRQLNLLLDKKLPIDAGIYQQKLQEYKKRQRKDYQQKLVSLQFFNGFITEGMKLKASYA